MTVVGHPERDLIAAMTEPGFYPERPSSVEFRQTHISCVFLAGQSVYKIKKPVRFSFVDYSTLELRYQFCHDEVRLNRRLTPRVYLGVFPIVRSPQGFALGPEPVEQFDPAAAEYAVKMRRLPDERSLERLVRAKQVKGAEMRAIAQVLAKFHAEAARDQSMRYGSPEAVAEVVSRNLEECRRFVGDTIRETEFERIARFNRGFVEANRELLQRRASNGMIREGHGDLRSEHICITSEIDIIDCVEFSERLRYADIASDLAFLLMDLDRLGAPALGSASTAHRLHGTDRRPRTSSRCSTFTNVSGRRCAARSAVSRRARVRSAEPRSAAAPARRRAIISPRPRLCQGWLADADCDLRPARQRQVHDRTGAGRAQRVSGLQFRRDS